MSSLPGRLIIVRHGESRWNVKSLWTGIRDVGLTGKGHHEAQLLGEALKDVEIDLAFVSQQLRAKETLEDLLQAAGQPDVPSHVSAAINERDYGSFTGQNKWQVETKIGEGAFENIRRGWDFRVPDGETLKDVYGRTVPFFRETVLPEVAAGKTVLMVSHGNAIRSLIKYIETVSDQDIEDIEMIFGTIITYELDGEGRQTRKIIKTIATVPPPA
ncbi:MAG TPA: 2,3-bisphosphoglycerate-dependent phosphoglycerate mutase [Candidatus Saccharimonadia bacterium]|jgi:2,3-bisphosphoglycerate-dependent phosphoglycerate mutase|nr:2,3-bisphosphoglycerate-dependent phosphoglycerate mutase [Candidatus Saccharimonadia bacterium]